MTTEDIKNEDLVQTHEDISEIPEGVEVSNSVGSEEPDAEQPEDVDYSDVEIDEEEDV